MLTIEVEVETKQVYFPLLTEIYMLQQSVLAASTHEGQGVRR